MHAKIAIPANITLEVFVIRFSRLLDSDAQAPLLVADPLPDRFASLEFRTSLESALHFPHVSTAPNLANISTFQHACTPTCNFRYTFDCRARTPNLAKLRISIVQYLNTAPLVWSFTHGPLRGKYDLSFTVPSLCAEALRSGAADIAIIPAIEYQRIGGFVVLPHLAIRSQNQIPHPPVIAQKPPAHVRP